MESLNCKMLRASAALKSALLVALAGCMLAACGGDDAIRDVGAQQLFEEGQEALIAGNYVGAISTFQQLRIRFPFNANAKQAELGMIYAYYRANQPDAAIDMAENFVRENPRLPEVAYCLYMIGLIRFDSAPNFIERIFRVDITERPPDESMLSFEAFQDLIRQFPDSIYASDARQRMVFLRNRLAQYENHVANYYMDRGAYVAAANRAKYALERYAGAPELEESLEIMIAAYEALGMDDLAEDSRRVLAENFGAFIVAGTGED